MSIRSPWHRPLIAAGTLAALCVAPSFFAACGGGSASGGAEGRHRGQSEFLSAPLAGRGGGFGTNPSAAGDSTAADAGAPAPPGKGSTPSTGRTVEETDLYRLSGNKLYYLNAYRGLMVFDVSDVTHPTLLGRSPIFGSPVEMIVRGTQATVIVADWYGRMEDGKPFHGSIVRGLDCSDPTNIKVVGEAKLGGWVRDSRVVGDVLYAVSEDYGWYYGWDGYYGGPVADGPGGGSPSKGPKLVVSAVSFGGGEIKSTGWKEFDGYQGIFNVTPNAILLAHDVPSDPSTPYSTPSGKTELQYIDISDPGGTIAMRGSLRVNGRVQGWGADNGRWNVDFADGKYAHTIGCGNVWCGGSSGNYVLATADFTDPDAPKVASELTIPSSGWSPTARFDNGRMYLSPESAYYYGGSATSTPFQIYDVSSPTAPKLAGTTSIDGNVWLFIPSGNRLFALGNDYSAGGGPYASSSKVALRYLDVTDAKAPKVLGTSEFGDGWAWTPAAGTFKAFTKDDKQGLVVLPFSGWSEKDYTYNNGVQLIEFGDTTMSTAGHASAHGWVERGIFVAGKIVTLSDLSLSVVDYSDRSSPKTIAELTLARNVLDAQPSGTTISQLSSDWWGNDKTSSEYRVLPIADAEENKLDDALASVTIDGVGARVFHNGNLAYVVSNLRSMGACPGSPSSKCETWTQQITVVDLTGGTAVVRGKVALPDFGGYWYGWEWGWYGCWFYDWFDGSDVVQVGGDALAFRRWMPTYDPSGSWDDAKTALYVVDLHDPDAPNVASTTITHDRDAWWGNLKAVGNTLYTTHYEWIEKPTPGGGSTISYVKYYLDRIDLTDRAHPRIGAKINVPGVLVGASETDPTMLYFVDYRWYGSKPGDDLAVAQIEGDTAYLQGVVDLDGWTGRVIVRGNTAYLSTEKYEVPSGYTGPRINLHAVDMSDPSHPVDRISSDAKGWGWLLDVQGDRAVVTSGWGGSGVDIYKLTDGAAPVFDQFVRTRGWWANSLSRMGDTLYLASGYWGVQTIPLK